jgi:2-hydroxychromene-2-carboxylate isomerase
VSALTRRVLPSAVVRASRIDAPARTAAAVRRRFGLPGRVELFFAFDDPCSAVAVLHLTDLLATRAVEVDLIPVVHRGIPDDPAVDRKRAYALVDARRLALRYGLVLMRHEPLTAESTAFLAAMAASKPEPERTAFCVRALHRLWFEGDGAVDHVTYAADRGDPEAVRQYEGRMRRRGPYDTPAAWVHGQWFFAHDRPAQIAARLDDLGWTA